MLLFIFENFCAQCFDRSYDETSACSFVCFVLAGFHDTRIKLGGVVDTTVSFLFRSSKSCCSHIPRVDPVVGVVSDRPVGGPLVVSVADCETQSISDLCFSLVELLERLCEQPSYS